MAKLQLKHASATKKTAMNKNKTKNVMGCRDSNQQKAETR